MPNAHVAQQIRLAPSDLLLAARWDPTTFLRGATSCERGESVVIHLDGTWPQTSGMTQADTTDYLQWP